ncbi:MAG: hypothetical protein ACYS0G_12980 [Planctomycetota bacterium]
MNKVDESPIWERRRATFTLPLRALTLFAILLGAGCVIGSRDWSYTYGEIEWHNVDRIEPGKTTFHEVLDLLGPPDAIVDGKGQLVDGEVGASMTIPTRTLAPPAGEVILLYFSSKIDSQMSGSMSGYHFSSTYRPAELFVYVSKNRRVVTSVAGPASVTRSTGAAAGR